MVNEDDKCVKSGGSLIYAYGGLGFCPVASWYGENPWMFDSKF